MNDLENAYYRAQHENLYIKDVSEDKFVVFYADKGTEFYIRCVNGKLDNCSCPHNFYRGTVCKHLVRVSMVRKLPL